MAKEEHLQGPPDMYDVISLRHLALAILRRWKLIAALVVVAVVTVFVAHRHFVRPAYESFAVISYQDPGSALNFDIHAFEALASSPQVMSKVLARTGGERTVSDLLDVFSFSMHERAPLLTARARTEDPEESLRLVDTWIAAVREETMSHLAAQVAERKSIVDANFATRREILTEYEDLMARFDTEYPLALLESGLGRLINDLATKEVQLESLRVSIPASEARVQVLREAAAENPVVLGSGYWLADPTSGGDLQYHVVASLEVQRQLVNLEAQLAADRQLIVSLETSIPEMRQRVQELNARLVDAKLRRERLLRELQEAKRLFDAAQSERTRILNLEAQLPDYARVDIISAPVLPEKPVADRFVFHLVIAVVLAVMAGMLTAMVLEWRWPTDAAAGERGRAVVQ